MASPAPHSAYREGARKIRIEANSENVGFPRPTLVDISAFRAAAKPDHKASRRATLLWWEDKMRTTKMLLFLALFVNAAIMAAPAQTTIFVPGNASGSFGNPVNQLVPMVSAVTVSGPGTITVTYVSGNVDVGGDHVVGPNGLGPWSTGGNQYPLQEATGVTTRTATRIGALIGVFVPAPRANHSGFIAIDGTKNAAPFGIMPGGLFFIGESKTFNVSQAGTLFLGINDTLVGDNSGGFSVTVSVQ